MWVMSSPSSNVPDICDKGAWDAGKKYSGLHKVYLSELSPFQLQECL